MSGGTIAAVGAVLIIIGLGLFLAMVLGPTVDTATEQMFGPQQFSLTEMGWGIVVAAIIAVAIGTGLILSQR